MLQRKVKKLADGGAFSVKIILYGVLEEDSFMLYRFLTRRRTKFMVFIANLPP